MWPFWRFSAGEGAEWGEEGTNTFDFVATLLFLERWKGRSQWGHVKMSGGKASGWKLLRLLGMVGVTKLLQMKYLKT